LTLDDDLAARLKKLAFEQDKPFKQVVNETLRSGLDAAHRPPRARRYRLEPVAMGEPRHDVDLVKALQLADALEDVAIARELEARK
jgi:hypothetical protein